MAESSKYYFVAHTKFQGQDIPILAWTPGEEYNRGWQSNYVTNLQGLKTLTDRASGAQGISIAIPRFYLMYFQYHTQIETLTIWGSTNHNEGSYGRYNNTLTFTNVVCGSFASIRQWKGLPAPAECLRNKFEKILGRELYIPVAVNLYVDPETTSAV